MNRSQFVHEIPGLNVLVDGFTLKRAFDGCTGFFLTHFHGDHYTGLKEDFDAGVIYCSEITGALVKNILGVDEKYIHTVGIGESVVVQNAKVTFLDANHCPGAVLLLFELNYDSVDSDRRVFLHTGDMRYHPKMKSYEAFNRLKIDTVYLDTTYCHPKHTFACQVDTIQEIVSAIEARLQEDKVSKRKERTVFLLSAYNIGKERILIQVAKQTGHKIRIDERKTKILKCLNLSSEELQLFTTDRSETPLHVCRMGFCGDTFPYFQPNFKNLQRYLDRTDGLFTQVYAFIPTGWAASSNYNKRNAFKQKDNLAIALIPYSEHSNYDELQEFIQFLRPREVVPTVFSDKKSYDNMVKRFHSLIDHTENLRYFLQKLNKGECQNASAAPDNTVDHEQLSSCGMSLFCTAILKSSGTNDGVLDPVKQKWELSSKDVQIVSTKQGKRNCDEDSKAPQQRPSKSQSKSLISWSCQFCTFLHDTPESSLFLTCSLCGSERTTIQAEEIKNEQYFDKGSECQDSINYSERCAFLPSSSSAPIIGKRKQKSVHVKRKLDGQRKKQTKLKHFFLK